MTRSKNLRVPLGRISDFLDTPEADRIATKPGSGTFSDYEVRVFPTRTALIQFLKKEASHSSHGALGRHGWKALIPDLVPINMVAYPSFERGF